ncbi:MAG: rod shape-determining protein MreC [Phycisphaerae bacterium]|nr:rod shape-determining protein MreC [Phycisphaerae bacterium]
MSARLRLPSRNSVFAFLMAVSVILILLPNRWTGGIKHLRQILVPFQDSVYRASSGSLHSSESPAPVTVQEYESLLKQLEGKRNEIVSLHMMIREMDAERPEIRLILDKLLDRSATRQARIVPARVIAADPSTWRDTFLLNAGKRKGARSDAWIASRRLVDSGTEDGVELGMLVLAREYLLGRVEEVTPYTSRLYLLSDTDSKVRVWIGRVQGDRFGVLPSAEAVRAGQRWAEPGQENSFLLMGYGGGKMIVDGVHEDYVNAGAIAKGDLIVSAGTSATLPLVMVIGHIDAIQDDPAQRQLRRLIVQCPINTAHLRWVYIVDAPPMAPADASR